MSNYSERMFYDRAIPETTVNDGTQRFERHFNGIVEVVADLDKTAVHPLLESQFDSIGRLPVPKQDTTQQIEQ